MKVSIAVTLDIDPEAWEVNYAVSDADAIRADVKDHIQKFLQEHYGPGGLDILTPERSVAMPPEAESKPSKGRLRNWRIAYRYPGTTELVFDRAGNWTGKEYLDRTRPVNRTHPYWNRKDAEKDAEYHVRKGGIAELFYVDPDGPRGRKHWKLVRVYRPETPE